MYAIGAFLVLLSFAAFKIYVPILGLCTVMPTIAQMTSLVLSSVCCIASASPSPWDQISPRAAAL